MADTGALWQIGPLCGLSAPPAGAAGKIVPLHGPQDPVAANSRT